MIFGFEMFIVKINSGSFSSESVLKKLIKKILVIYTIFLARQNEGENHPQKYFLIKNCQGFRHDSLLHVCDRALKIAIFGLEFHLLLFV